MKKLLSFFLAIAILLSMAMPAMAAEEDALVTEETVVTEVEVKQEETEETQEVLTQTTEEVTQEPQETLTQTTEEVTEVPQETLTQTTDEVTEDPANQAVVNSDYEIPFDELLFASSVQLIGADPVTYYENETPTNPAITVVYKDNTSGPLPENVRVKYPDEWPTVPGTYTVTILVANQYEVPCQVTVLALEPQGPETKLEAPAVEVVKDSAGQNVLAWEAVEFATGYEIYRATSKSGTYKKVGTAEETTWMGENIPVGKTYYYKVVAVYAEDTALNSDQSNAVSIAGICARPEVSVAFNAANGKPSLSWKKVSGAKKYEIYRAVVENPNPSLPIAAAEDDSEEPGITYTDADFKKLTTTTKTSYVDTSAKAGIGLVYVYKVRVIGSKSSYNSVFSEPVETMCFMNRPSLSVSADAATGKPKLSWKKVSGAKYYAIGRLKPDGDPKLLDFDNYQAIAFIIDELSYLDEEAQAGNEYTYVIMAANGGMSAVSYFSDVEKTTCKLARPVLKTDMNENGQPVITWEAVEGAISYKVYRSTKSNKSYKEVETVTEPSYVDESVSAGKTYYYKVVAVGENAKSAETSYVKLTGKCAIPELKVEAGSTGKPVLSWNKISGAKKYEIHRSINGGAFKKLTTTTKTTYTDTKATEGATCTYKVKALGSKSSYNGNFSQELGCIVVCAAPSLSVKIDTATGKPSLSWKKVTGAAAYEIYRAENGGEFSLLTTITGTSYADSETKADNKYSYYVITVGKSGEFNSIKSAEKTVTVTVGQPKVKGSINEDGKPVLTWEAVEDAVKYEIYRSTKSNKSYKKIATVESLTYVDTDVSAGKTYYYKVLAVGENSQTYSSYVKMTGKCAQPEAYAILNVKSGKPYIAWEKISGAKKYDVYRATSETGKYSKIGTTTKLSYTDTKASVGTTYYYKVVAVGSKSSYNSLQSAATEGVVTLMAQPSMKVKIDTKTGKPVVSWGKVSGAKQYVVMYADVTEFMESETGPDEAYLEENMKPVVTTKTSVTLTDAEIGHVYLVTMVAVPKNEEFVSVPVEPQYVAATCKIPKITGYVDKEYGKPGAYWNEVEGAEGYIVYRSTKSGSGYKALGVVYEPGFIDASAVKGKTYYYKVTAVAGYSESGMSNSVKLKSK